MPVIARFLWRGSAKKIIVFLFIIVIDFMVRYMLL